MFAKRLYAILFAFVISLFSVTISYAEGNIILFQAYAWEQNIDFYMVGDMIPDNLSCKVSNQTAEIADYGLLAEKDITVRTTILLDISTSMPSQTRGNVKSMIDMLIHDIGQNEQYKIVVFGEQLTVLHDYTSDRYDLTNAVNEIEFNGQQSKIYDAIYNTIPKVQPVEGAPCYYRTIVITDGIDDTASGVTKEELYLKLQTDTYPVDIVEVSKSQQAEPEKELSALTRMSNGRYVNLYPESDLEGVVTNLSVDGVFWIRSILPGMLLDGSTRQVDISDGISTLQFDIKVPVFDIPVVETPAPTEGPEKETPALRPSVSPEVDIPTISAQTSVPTTTATSQLTLDVFGGYTIVIFVGVGVILIILIAIIVAVGVVRGKRNKSNGNSSDTYANSEISKPTEMISGDSMGSSSGTYCIRLRNTSNPDQIWNLSLSNVIIIGRYTACQVCIDDRSISRQQCKLYLNNTIPVVENISKSNITQLNGEQLSNPRAIKEGDRIKCGRVTLMVDSLYGSNSGNIGNLNKMTEFVDV